MVIGEWHIIVAPAVEGSTHRVFQPEPGNISPALTLSRIPRLNRIVASYSQQETREDD